MYSGNDDMIVPLMSLGGKGVISVLSNVAPRETHDLCQKWFDGDVKGSLALQFEYLDLIKALFCEVARIAKERNCGRMEWTCLNWNTPSINFYLSMGAVPMDEWTTYRLTAEKIDELLAR
jgi:hypothetical protein